MAAAFLPAWIPSINEQLILPKEKYFVVNWNVCLMKFDNNLV
jgi:hypothetical protein